jgi:hypothetical protein
MEDPLHGIGRCKCCHDGIEQFKEDERKKMEEYGWVVHFVSDGGKLVSCHTHGLVENFDHEDLEITLSMNPKIIHSVFSNIVNLIESGKKFHDGDIADEIIQHPYQVKFIEAEEGSRPVLRVILPDADGNLEQEDMAPDYAAQYLNRRNNYEPNQN